jgi:hypothetical protein
MPLVKARDNEVSATKIIQSQPRLERLRTLDLQHLQSGVLVGCDLRWMNFLCAADTTVQTCSRLGENVHRTLFHYRIYHN